MGIMTLDPLTRLTMWRELNEDRGEAIREAREAGHTWQEIQDASGLSRAQVNNLAKATEK